MELAKKDLELIRDALLRNFTLQELEDSGWLDRAPDGELRRQLGEIDQRFFSRFYLHEHFTKPLAKMHLALFQRVKRMFAIKGRVNDVAACPRGHGKTTIATLAVPLHKTLYELRRHILIISDSFDQAKEQLATVKDELENNDRIIEDFGSLKGPKWQAAEIETNTGVKLVALGARMKIRGRKYRHHRPDLMIVDDIENLVAVQSEMRRNALSDWFLRSVMRAGWDDTKVLVVGNFLHHDCLLARLVANPMFGSLIFRALVTWPTRMDLWDEWKEIITDLSLANKEEVAQQFYVDHQSDMLAGALSAWPEAFPVYDLMVMRVSEGEASFSMELMNEPTDPTKALFKNVQSYRKEYRVPPGRPADEGEVWLIPNTTGVAVPLSACAIFGFTDPSMGRTVSADFASISIIAKAPTNQLFILEDDSRRRPPAIIMQTQVRWAKQYSILRWGIESNAFQALYATESARTAMEEASYLPILAINQLANKALRLQSLEPDFSNGYLLVHETGQEQLKKQLAEYPMGAHDDALDALEGARSLAREWVPLKSTEVVQGAVHSFSESQSRGSRRQAIHDPWAVYEEQIEHAIYEERERLKSLLTGQELQEALAALPVSDPMDKVFVPQIYV